MLERWWSRTKGRRVTDLAPDPALDEIGRKLLALDRGLGLFRLAHLVDALRGDSGVTSVLSVGCGKGFHEAFLARAFPRLTVVGVDLLEPEVEGGANLRFMRGDLNNRSFRESIPQADFVYSIECLEHIEDDVPVVQAAASRVTRDGFLYVQVPFANVDERADPEICRKERETYGHVRPGYGAEQMEGLVTTAGLEPLSVAGAFWFPIQPIVWFTLERFGPEPLVDHWREVMKIAELDVRAGLPKSRNDATAIKVLARRR